MFGMLTPSAQAVPGPAYVYKTYEELFGDLNGRMQSDGYKVVKARSHRGKIGGSDVPGNEMVRCDLVCDRGGRPYKCLATKHKTSTKKTDCPWKAKAVNRKMMGGWVLTIMCDQHNHEPGTPEPPDVEAVSEHDDAEGELDVAHASVASAPALDSETRAALAMAGVSQAALRLTGDTFQQIKGEYRKMTKAHRLRDLAELQMRIAAIYAVENEDMQRQVRVEQQERRHRQIEQGRRSTAPEKRARRASAMDGLDEAQAQSPTRRRTQTQEMQARQQDEQTLQQQLDHPGQQMDPQLMAQQPHAPDDVDPFLHSQFQVSVPPGPVGTPPVGQFHHFPPAPRRLRGRPQ